MDRGTLLLQYHSLIKELEISEVKKDSTEYSLLNLLSQITDLLAHVPSRQGVKDATEPLRRFCIEYMEPKSELYRKISFLTKKTDDFGRTLAK